MRYHFAAFILDTDNHRLIRGGEALPVEPQVFDLLHLLVRNPGRLIARDELIETIWQGRIVSDSAISARIAAARKAVDDDGKRQAIIRTVARRGLRMVAEVTPQGLVSKTKPQSLSTPSIRYAKSVSGHALAYALSGSGPPVLRSYPATHLEAEWHAPRERALIDLICAKNTLLRVDYIGSGMSDRNVVLADFDEAAENLLVAADAAGLDRFALFSESGGVHAALRLAAKFPEHVTRLAILGGYVQGRSRRSATPKPDFLHSMIAENWENPETGFARALSLSYFPDGPMDEVYEHARIMQAAYNQADAATYRDAINEVSNADLLAQVRCPTLIVHGRRDAVHPLSEAQKLAAGIPDAELLVLETANHLPLPGHPTWADFAQAFRGFLDRD